MTWTWPGSRDKGKPPDSITITVVCPQCKTRQILYAAAKPTLTASSLQTIRCIKCATSFDKLIPKVIEGPFSI
jgi:ribosomal protein S27E